MQRERMVPDIRVLRSIHADYVMRGCSRAMI